jgi:hypothetical protein
VDSPLPEFYGINQETDRLGGSRHRENAMSKMKQVKSTVKGVLNQKVRLGLFSVPLWVVGVVVVAKAVRARRREQRYA